jgi:DNA-binding transcriptional regulator YdaS (Cro superfamily)
MTDAEVQGVLRRACNDAGSQRAWADLHNVSDQYVSDVLKGRRRPGPAILEALGLEVSYRKKRYR